MNDVVGLLLVVVFGGAGLISIITIVNLLLPVPVQKIRAELEHSMGRSLLLGLINSVLAVGLAALFSLPMRAGGVLAAIFAFLMGLVALAIVALLLVGLVAATSLLGERVGSAKSLVAIQVRGGVLLLLACLTPFLGWFVFTPLLVWTALGASLLALFRRRNAPAPLEEPAA